MENKYVGTQAQENFVAKSFIGWEIICEPYPNDKGAIYIKVRNPKTGSVRDVRFYTPKTPKAAPASVIIPAATQNMAYPFGFTADPKGTDGFITLYTDSTDGDYETTKDFFHKYNCRWNKWFHWYAPANTTIPEEELLPGMRAITLPYAIISDSDGNVLPDTQLRETIDSILYTESGEHYGNVGDRIDVTVTVTSNKEFTTQYGISHCITMEDAAGHTFVWFTAAKSWEPGTLHHIRATIKEHSQYKGLRQTIITRAMEVGKQNA